MQTGTRWSRLRSALLPGALLGLLVIPAMSGCGAKGGSAPATVRVLYSGSTQGYVEPCG